MRHMEKTEEEQILETISELRMLSSNEYLVFKMLFHSKHALTAKGVQKAITYYLLRRYGNQEENLEFRPVNDLLKLARNYKLAPPSDLTIKNCLDRLISQGLVEKRLLAESGRANALYFLSEKYTTRMVKK